MATTVNIHEAKTQLSKLIEMVGRGEEVVIAKAGKPKVKLVSVEAVEPRTPGRFAGMIEVGNEFFEDLPEAELQAWEGGGNG